MKEKYRIGEVEEMLGIPRTTIRYYIKKGLLNVDKDESNGYRYYSQNDVLEIMHVIIGRNVLNMSIENSKQRIHARSLDDFHKIFYCQEGILTERIQRSKRSLAVLGIYKNMLARIEQNLNKISVVEAGPFHVFHSSYLFNTRTTVFEVGFNTAVFADKGEPAPVFQKVCAFVHDEDSYLLSGIDFDAKEYTVNNVQYVYTVIKSDKEKDCGALLAPALLWAKEHGRMVSAPFFLAHLFEVEEQGAQIHHYEAYLPVI